MKLANSFELKTLIETAQPTCKVCNYVFLTQKFINYAHLQHLVCVK